MIVLGVAIGILVAFVIVAAIEFWGSLLFMQAAPVDPVGQVAARWVASMPLPAKLLVVAGWLLGALAGAAAAGRVARRSTIGWIPAALVAAVAIANVVLIPHPLWMTVAAVLAPIVGGWFGVRPARSRT